MKMEFMAEFTEGMSRDRALQIIKRKRTKRQKPCSPFQVSSSGTTSGCSDGDHCLIDNSKVNRFPVTSSYEASSKEDEDMANCLIMLAQSVSPVEKSDQIHRKTERLSSRRFTEMETVTGKGDLYVYECKTCNRTFPSFQALGGHRASHKKPKVNVEEKKPNSVDIITMKTTEYVKEDEADNNKAVAVAVAEEDEENKVSIIVSNNVYKSPSQTGIINHNNGNSKVKVHECSICGSEFLSGQALGGHMRKHRPIPPGNNRAGISTTNDNEDSTGEQIITEKSPVTSVGMLSLDLNFPPPEVAEDHRSTFPFTGGSSEQRLMFSAPAFVDCHY